MTQDFPDVMGIVKVDFGGCEVPGCWVVGEVKRV